MSRRRPRQTEMKLIPAGRGGWRPGAGRKAKPGARVLHRSRERIPGHCPVHVTVRLRKGFPTLRRGRFVRAFRHSLAERSVRPGFRVVHYSIQSNHLHFLIEAQGKVALGCGMKSLSARIGRCVNRVFERRGPVLDGRYHHRLLRTPREVRHALAYVLPNARHHFYERHGRPPPTVAPDAASSARWFEGWKHPPPLRPHRVGPCRPTRKADSTSHIREERRGGGFPRHVAVAQRLAPPSADRPGGDPGALTASRRADQRCMRAVADGGLQRAGCDFCRAEEC